MVLVGCLVDTADEDVRAEGGDDGDSKKPEAGAPRVHICDFLLFITLLGLEELGVGLELEDEVANVGEEEDDRGSSGKNEESVERAVVGRRGVGGKGDSSLGPGGVV